MFLLKQTILFLLFFTLVCVKTTLGIQFDRLSFIFDEESYNTENIDSFIYMGLDGFIMDVNDIDSLQYIIGKLNSKVELYKSDPIRIFLSYHEADSIIVSKIKTYEILDDSILSLPAKSKCGFIQIFGNKLTSELWQKPINELAADSLEAQKVFINYLFEEWHRTGVKPNIVVTKGYSSGMDSLKKRFNEEPAFIGNIITDRSPLYKVFWNNRDFVTGKHFSLPLNRLDNVNVLYAPGYYFSPSKLRINRTNEEETHSIFAIPYQFDDHLRMMMNFNYSFKNEWNKKESFDNRGVFFVKDKEHGIIASFEDESYIKLGRPRKLGLFNHSFSISMRLCFYPDTDEELSKVQVSIKEGSKALDSIIRKEIGENLPSTIKNFADKRNKKEEHLNIQKIIDCVGRRSNERLRMALSDDKIIIQFNSHQITSPLNIVQNEWYHLVLQYDDFLNQLDFYVDGVLVNSLSAVEPIRFDRHLYLSDYDGRNNFKGYMKQFIIWHRALSQNEIALNSKGKLIIEEEMAAKKGDRILLIIAGIFLLLLYPYFLLHQSIFKQKRSKRNVPQLLMMGEFTLNSHDKIKISERMNQITQQLFLLLYFNTYQKKGGISTHEMSEAIWPGIDEVEVKNYRGKYIKELREILDEIGAGVEYKDDRWRLRLSDETYCDYHEIVKLFSRYKIVKSKKMIKSIDQKSLLPENDYLWLKSFKDENKTKIVAILMHELNRLKKKNNKSAAILNLCRQILYFDPTNDEVVSTKIKWHLIQGQISEAEATYKSYCRSFIDLDSKDAPANYQSLLL